MAYVYLIYEKENLKLENYLRCLNFDKLPEKEICEVVYDKETYNFFKLNSLEFNIANKVFSYKDDDLFLVEEVDMKFKFTPNANSKLFYDLFEDRLGPKYKNFIESLKIKKSDMENFMNMFERVFGKIVNDCVYDTHAQLSSTSDKFESSVQEARLATDYMNIRIAIKIYLEEGKIHRLLKASRFLVMEIQDYIKYYLDGEIYYPCGDPDSFFDLARKINAEHLKDEFFGREFGRMVKFSYITNVARYYADFDLKRDNALYFKEAHPALFNFYEKQIFTTPKLTILDKSADEIATEMIKIEPCPMFTEILKIILKRVEAGETISESIVEKLCHFRKQKTAFEIYSTILRKSKNIDTFISAFKSSRSPLTEIFDMLMERIDSGMENITLEKLQYISGLTYWDQTRRDKIYHYLELYSTEK